MAESKYLCTMCREKFTRADAVLYKYFPDPRVCFKCYKEARAKDHSTWCFGKEDVTEGDTTTKYGYDPERWECSKECPDRVACPLFIIKPYQIKGRVIKASKVELFIKTGRKQKV